MLCLLVIGKVYLIWRGADMKILRQKDGTENRGL